MGLLSGRRFVITGAGRGLGAAFAMVFAAEGAALVLTGRDTAALGRVADAIADTGAERPETARLDLSEPVEAAAVARDIAARCPDIDGLINNGATWQTGRITDHDSAALAAVVTSQVTGAVVVTRELAPALLAGAAVAGLAAAAASRLALAGLAGGSRRPDDGLLATLLAHGAAVACLVAAIAGVGDATQHAQRATLSAILAAAALHAAIGAVLAGYGIWRSRTGRLSARRSLDLRIGRLWHDFTAAAILAGTAAVLLLQAAAA